MDKPEVSKELIVKRKEILNKATTKDLKKKWEASDRDEIKASVDAINPPIITEPRCQVCTSQYRQFIEHSLIKGHLSYEAIERSIPDDNGKKPSRKSIASHYKNHMRIEETIARKEMEEEAESIGKPIEKGIQKITTERGILRALINKAFEDAQNGIIVVEARDLIQMMKLQREIEEKSSHLKSDQAEVYLRLFLTAVKNVFDNDQQIKLSNEIKRLRQEDEIPDEVEKYVNDEHIEDVEIVDEISDP